MLYICTYVCVYVRMYGCMYVYMYVCMYVYFCVCMYVMVFLCLYICVYVRMYYIYVYKYNLFKSMFITIGNTTCLAYSCAIDLYIILKFLFYVYVLSLHKWCAIHPCLFCTVPYMHIGTRIDV